LSDDGWFGDTEPAPAPGSAPYGQGQGRRGVRGRQAQPEQPGQYAQQPQYPQQYSQDPYESNQYSQSYPAQPQQSYYDELGPRDMTQDWNSPPQAYPDPQSYQQQTPQTQPTQAQPPYTGRRAQTARPPQQPQPQPARPAADPYASGSSYGSDSYASDPYASDSYASDPYAADTYSADPYASSGGGYGQSEAQSQSQPRPAARDVNGDGYGSRPRESNSGGYAAPARDYASGPASPSASGSYPAPERDPRQSSGTYPATDRDPRQSTSGSYSTTGGYSSNSYPSGSYPTSGPGSAAPPPGRPPAGPQGQPQGQDPYSRRRGATPSGGHSAPYEADDDEFPARPSAAGRRGPVGGYGEAGNRSESAPDPANGPRPRRRAVPDLDDEDEADGRFNLIDDDEDDGDAGSGRGRKPKQKKGRNCLAVFIAFSVIAGGLGYGGYKGIQWYQSKYGAPPDYVSTVGTGAKVDVTIPSGSGGKTIGGLLLAAGIVKSQRAFTDACTANIKCSSIQAGTFLLPKGINAASAVTALLDPKNRDGKSQLITYGGERAGQIFAALETKTGWKDADIRAAIAGGKIDLPAWATAQPGAKYPYAHIEGFIASESYVLTDYKTPTDLLKKMVDDQLTVFNEENLAAKATALKVSEYQLLIIASLARAEAGTNTADLNKIAGVVFNRFASTSLFAHLGFDTSTLYGMGNVGTVPNNADKANPYNTSVEGIKGLPPGPIDNPDQQSVDAAINPNRASTYYYFCATADGVQYAQNNTQWQNLGKKYPGLCGTG